MTKQRLAVRMAIMIVVLSFCGAVLQASQHEPNSVSKRVLFIGNSYTAQIRKSLTHVLANSAYKQTAFSFITKGGATLQQHLADKNTLNQIKTGHWDFVVLQDQSQRPALPGQQAKSFHNSVDTLSKLIRHAGAEPVLYMTWGRRNGDLQNKDVFPDYDTMQKRLCDAYRKAAKNNKALLAPVGQAWSLVRKRDKALGEDLYKKDGSHPSSKGAYLASCVFFRTLFNDSLESLQPQGPLSKHERKLITDAVLSLNMSHNKSIHRVR
jgi:hypothetical protein